MITKVFFFALLLSLCVILFVRFSYVIKMIIDVGSMLNDFDRGRKMLFYEKDRKPKRFKGAISKEKVFLLDGRKHLTIERVDKASDGNFNEVFAK